jgi:hypothetical protein
LFFSLFFCLLSSFFSFCCPLFTSLLFYSSHVDIPLFFFPRRNSSKRDRASSCSRFHDLDLETSRMRKPWPALGRSDAGKKIESCSWGFFNSTYTKKSVLWELSYSMRTDGWTDRHNEAISRILQF